MMQQWSVRQRPSFQAVRRFLRRIDPYVWLLALLTALATTPLWAPGYFYEAHDGRHSVFYLTMFDASIRDGALWPRWAMHHIQGYGYPTFVILAPLGFFVGEFFVLLGAGYTLAAKLSWSVGFLVSGLGMYHLVAYWLRKYADAADSPALQPAALAAALLYVFIPYHLAGAYVRAALNDTLLFAWFPWTFLLFDRLIAQGLSAGWQRRLGAAILLLAGTLMTHSFALISFAPLLVSYVLYALVRRWRSLPSKRSLQDRFGATLGAGVLAFAGGLAALAASATFLLPLLLEGQQHLQQQVYTTGAYSFQNHFVYVGQFLSAFWGFGFSDDPTGANDGMSFQIGLIAGIVMIVGAAFLRGRSPLRGIMRYLWCATILLLVLMTPLSRGLWEALPILGVIQFPWRLLSLAALTVSGLAGLLVWQLARSTGAEHDTVDSVLLVGLLIVFAGSPYIFAQLQPVEPWRNDGRAVFNFEREHPDMIAYTEWTEEPFTETPLTAEYALDSYTESRGRTTSLSRIAVIAGEGRVVDSYSRGSSGGGVVQMETDGVVRIHYLAFPGWQVHVDDRLASHRISKPHGTLEVDVPAGDHRVSARMAATPVRRLGSAISWITVALAAGLLLWPQRRNAIRARAKDSTEQS